MTTSATPANALVPQKAKRRIRRRGREVEFLPATLEIVERPLSPAPHLVAATIIAFLVIALAWSWIGKVDIIATATGKIIPSGRAKVIQPLEIGVVKSIYVEDGEHVAAGQVLIELDPTASEADKDRLASDYARHRIDVARLEAQLGRRQGDPFLGFADVDPTILHVARDRMEAQAAEQQAKLAGIDRQLAEKRADASAVKATIAKLEASLPLLEKRAEIRREGVSTGFGSKIADLEAQQAVVDQKGELVVQRSRLDQAAQAAEALAHQRQETEAEYRQKLLADLTKAETETAELNQELRKATEKDRLRRLTAPVDGTVQQLSVHTIGGVVTPAQPLMVIVPSNAELEVEAIVENRDIGFVEVGQPAEIKIETFNFTRYGLLHGRVARISHDAVPMETHAAAPNSPPSPASSSEALPPQRLAYVARISLLQTSMQVGSKLIPLEPGEAVTVEIKTGQRSVLDYLLSPLQVYRHDGLRER